MKKLIVILFLFAFISAPVFARSGCCSWHGGVAGCDSATGIQVCNDGTYSPSCTCYYAPNIPIPTPIIIPSYIQGSSTVKYNDFTKSYDVTFEWNNWIESSGWSLGISQYSGADPGPNVDAINSPWTFKNIYPGRRYINTKAVVDGYWSRVSYWTVDVPLLPTSTPIPTITLTPTATPIPIATIPSALKQEAKTKTTRGFNLWELIKDLFNERK